MATQNSVPIENLSDEEFGELARSILVRELGPHGLIRFQNLSGSGSDYSRDRHLWQAGTTVKDVLQRIRERNS
jgi:hypothetical protein